MKHWCQGFCLFPLLAASALAAVDDGGSFRFIAQRNAFGLRPVTAPMEEIKRTAIAKPPREEIQLTGISTLLGSPKVFLQAIDPQTRKTDFSPALAIGERFGTVEILEVDAKSSVVRVRDEGNESTLTFRR